MGRTDAWALQMPEPLPLMPETADVVNIQGANADAAAQITQMLQDSRARVDETSPRAALTNCPTCKASLSGVEQKFEKCLTCGNSFAAAAGDVSVSVGI